MEQDYKIKVGITQGDINGVGYEVILKTLSDPRITEMCTPVVYGSSKVAAYHRSRHWICRLLISILLPMPSRFRT